MAMLVACRPTPAGQACTGKPMDFTLTEEQQRWRAIARDFAETVIKPDVLRRDRLPTAAERISWDWIRQADAAGLRTLAVGRRSHS